MLLYDITSPTTQKTSILEPVQGGAPYPLEGYAKKRLVQEQLKPKSSERTEACMGCGGICVIFLLVLGFAAAIVAYYVFAVIALVNNKETMIQERCDESQIWAFVLTVLIMNLVMGRNAKNQASDDVATRFGSSVIQLCIAVGVGTWGATEVWGSDCARDKLSPLLIYRMAEIMTSLLLSVAVICILFLFVIICMVCREPEEGETTEEKRLRELLAQMEAQTPQAELRGDTTGATTGGGPSLPCTDRDECRTSQHRGTNLSMLLDSYPVVVPTVVGEDAV
jgi:NADH:ubiquinone oxidoreductase subunit 6 (subunit J)